MPAASSACRATATAELTGHVEPSELQRRNPFRRLEAGDRRGGACRAFTDVERLHQRDGARSGDQVRRELAHGRTERRDDAEACDDDRFRHAAYVTIPTMRRQPPLVAMLALVVATASTLCGAEPRDLFDDIYAKSHGLQTSIRTVTARFVEESTSALLTVPVVSRGTLAVVRPDRVVMRYSDPPGRVLLIDGDQLTLVWPAKGVRERSNIGDARRRIDKYFVDKSPDELRRNFAIAARVTSDRGDAWEVSMTPTRSQIRQGLTGLTLWIDRSSLMLKTMRMEFPGGDSKTLVFEDVVVNGTVDPRAFVLD